MVAKDQLFSGTFEQSKKIVSKSILTEEGAQIGVFSSMSLWKRITGLMMLPLFAISYGVGVVLPEHFQQSTEGVQAISLAAIEIIARLGQFSRYFIICFVCMSVGLIISNILPKPNYAYQLLYGNVTLTILSITTTISVFPLTAGLTIAAFGWIGFLPQLLLCLYLWKLCVIDKCQQLRTAIYQESTTAPDWGSKLISFIKTYGGILLGLSILNRWTLNLGELVKDPPGLLSFLYGWIFLLFMFLMLFALGQALKNTIIAYYFFRYQKEYRKHFNISDEQWYGKWRSKILSK